MPQGPRPFFRTPERDIEGWTRTCVGEARHGTRPCRLPPTLPICVGPPVAAPAHWPTPIPHGPASPVCPLWLQPPPLPFLYTSSPWQRPCPSSKHLHVPALAQSNPRGTVHTRPAAGSYTTGSWGILLSLLVRRLPSFRGELPRELPDAHHGARVRVKYC